VTTLVERPRLIRDLLRVAGIDHPNAHGAIAGLGRAAPRSGPDRNASSPTPAAKPPPPTELAPKIHEIAAYWRERCNHPKAKLDPKRYRAVRARLICRDQDESVDDRVAYIKQAIDGAAHAALVNERTGEPYNDLELICRNEVKLDSFARREGQELPAPSPGQDAAAYLRVKRKRLTDSSYRDYEAASTSSPATSPTSSSRTSSRPSAPSGSRSSWTPVGRGAPRTYNKNLSIVRRLLQVPVLRGRLHGDPTLAIERAKARGVYRTTFTPTSAARSSPSQDDLRDRIALRLLLDYALRKGSLQASSSSTSTTSASG
jgi:hypothetical protein